MKFKVKEKFTVVAWTYVEASDEAEAIKKLENGDEINTDFDFPDSQDVSDTYWHTLEQVK